MTTLKYLDPRVDNPPSFPSFVRSINVSVDIAERIGTSRRSLRQPVRLIERASFLQDRFGDISERSWDERQESLMFLLEYRLLSSDDRASNQNFGHVSSDWTSTSMESIQNHLRNSLEAIQYRRRISLSKAESMQKFVMFQPSNFTPFPSHP